jgi:hypothetical protein
MRKVVAISFLLLANIILLAHTFVPHHHHEGAAICFSSHQHDYDQNRNHNIDDCTHPSHHEHSPACGHNHQEGDGCPSDCCNISKDVYARILEDDEIFSLLNLFSWSDRGVDLIYYFSNENFDNSPLSGIYGLPFRRAPYLPSYFTNYIIGSFGLRGPPPTI